MNISILIWRRKFMPSCNILLLDTVVRQNICTEKIWFMSTPRQYRFLKVFAKVNKDFLSFLWIRWKQCKEREGDSEIGMWRPFKFQNKLFLILIGKWFENSKTVGIRPRAGMDEWMVILFVVILVIYIHLVWKDTSKVAV